MVFWHQSGTKRHCVIHISPGLDIFASTGGSAGDLRAIRTESPIPSIHALRRLRTPEPGAVALERRHMGLPFRGAQTLRTAAPGTASDHFV